MVGLHLASLIDRKKYNVILYHEMWHGQFDTSRSLEKFDVVILSGLQKDIDRMRQLSYYFRKAGVLVIAGGSFCTLYPEFSTSFFDVICAGGVEGINYALRDFENNCLQKIYHSPQYNIENYNLDYGILRKNGINLPLHSIEASRGCIYNCDFCALPAENTKYAKYGIDSVRANFQNSIKNSRPFSFQNIYPLLSFIDNNISVDKHYLKSICDYIRKEKRIKGWSALITQNILKDRELISLMANSKCITLFTGIESLNENFLKTHSKRQNMSNHSNVIENIHYAQKKGIIIIYGYLFDPRIESVQDMRDALKYIVNSNVLTFPTYIGFISPLLGTKLLRESVFKKDLLPGLLARDLEANTIAWSNTKDSKEALSAFARELYIHSSKILNKSELIKKTARSIVKYGASPIHWMVLYKNNFRIIMQTRKSYKTNRTYLGGRDILDPVYFEYPEGLNLKEKRKYFDPLTITDADGNPSDWLKRYINDY